MMIEEVVVVPDADEMDNQTFLKHFDKRHKEDAPVEGTVLHKLPHIQDAWVRQYRAFHDLQHRTNPDAYDHEHVWEDDDIDG